MVLRACTQAGQWHLTLSLLQEMASCDVVKDSNTYSLSITCCEAGRLPELQSSLFEEMQTVSSKKLFT